MGIPLPYDMSISNASFLKEEGPYAAIDLGSNTCRLLIARRINNCLEPLEVLSRFTRLGQGISKSNFLSDEAMDRSVKALEQFIQKIQRYRPLKLYAVATEAVRRAKNKTMFLERVKNQLGLTMHAISQREEARLALKGCANLLNPNIPYALVFDIGGASTEVMWIQQSANEGPVIIDWLSLPFGVVTLMEDYHTDHAADYRAIRENTFQSLEDFTQKYNIHSHILANQVQILGTSGTATTAVAIHHNLKRYERTKIDGMKIHYKEIRDVIKMVQMMTYEERNFNRCIGIGRGDLVLGGLAILEGIFDSWPVGEMTVADRGVREGIVTELAFGQESSFTYKPYLPIKRVA